jgi:hypothetical protein
MPATRFATVATLCVLDACEHNVACRGVTIEKIAFGTGFVVKLAAIVLIVCTFVVLVTLAAFLVFTFNMFRSGH